MKRRMVEGFKGNATISSKINLGMIKRYYYLSAMKNLKISDDTHQELKRFAANNNGKMTDFANNWIVYCLTKFGHTFKVKKQQPKSKKP